MKNEDDDNHFTDMEPLQECEHMKIEKMQGENTVNIPVVFPVNANQQSLPKEMTTEGTQIEELDQAIEHAIFVRKKVETLNQLQGSVNIHDNQELKTHSKDASTVGDSASSKKKEAALSSGKLSKYNQESKTQSFVKPKIPIYPREGDHVTSSFNKKTASCQSFEKKSSSSKSLHMSINFTS